MLVTLDTFQLLMSSLKLAQAVLQPRLAQGALEVHAASAQQPLPELAQKTYDRSSTRDTSHVLMWPYVAAAVAGSAHHASRAASSAVRSANSWPVAESRLGGVPAPSRAPPDRTALASAADVVAA